MLNRKKVKSWLEKILSYRILHIPFGTWLLMLFLFSCFVGYILLVMREYQAPSIETFEAKVSKKWIAQYNDKTGGYRVYYVRLKHDEDEITCKVSPLFKDVWNKLEQERSYEFEISRSRTRCYINKAAETWKIRSGGGGE